MLKVKRLSAVFDTVQDIAHKKYTSFVKGSKSMNVYNCIWLFYRIFSYSMQYYCRKDSSNENYKVTDKTKYTFKQRFK